MFKLWRNTAFTIAALALTTLGLSWNKETVLEAQPIDVGQAALASQTDKPIDQPFPVSIEFSRSEVKLGQYQELTVKTAPRSELDIVTQYPDGNINNPQTVKVMANDKGEYTTRYKLNNFQDLGIFHVKVTAYSGNRSSEVTGRFLLKTWAQDGQASTEEERYVYPLVP